MEKIEKFSSSEKEDSSPKYILGIRQSAIVETLLFLSFVTLLSYLFGDGDRFINVQPHPFWFIILVVTVQYGTNEGIVASLLATLFLYVGNIPEIRFSQSLFEYRLNLAIQPILWVATSAFLGEIRMRVEFDRERLKKAATEAKEQADTIASAYEVLKEKKELIEYRLAGQVHSLASAYEALKSLESMNPAAIFLSLTDFIHQIIEPKKFSIYTLADSGFEASVCEGWTEQEGYKRRFPLDHPLTKALITKRRLLSVVNEEEGILLEGEGILACPIIDKESGEIYGMLKIEDMPLSEMNISNIEICKTLCEIIGTTFSNAKKFQFILRNAIYAGDEVGLMSYALFRIMRRIYRQITIETHHPFYQMDIRAEDVADKTLFKKMHTILFDVLRRNLPTEVTIYQAGKDELHYLVLAPLTDEKKVREYKQKILEEIASLEEFKSNKTVITLQELGALSA